MLWGKGAYVEHTGATLSLLRGAENMPQEGYAGQSATFRTGVHEPT
jgi:hypothetical protein